MSTFAESSEIESEEYSNFGYLVGSAFTDGNSLEKSYYGNWYTSPQGEVFVSAIMEEGVKRDGVLFVGRVGKWIRTATREEMLRELRKYPSVQARVNDAMR